MGDKKYDISAIMKEFDDDDFGFTAVDDDFDSVLAEKDETVEEYKQRLKNVEKLIIPFLTKLLKTSDQPVIKWPNRGPVIEAQIQKILNLTRD
jgi:archaellum component FlaC